jgi:hypothetical protein
MHVGKIKGEQWPEVRFSESCVFFYKYVKNRNILVRPRKEVRLIDPSRSTREMLRCPILCTSCCIFRFSRLAILFYSRPTPFAVSLFSEALLLRGSSLVQPRSRWRVTCKRRHLPTSLARPLPSSGVPWNFVHGCGGSTNSIEDRGQRERGSGGGNPLVRGSAQFANE